MSDETPQAPEPGACISWEQRLKEYAEIQGDPKVVERVWKQTDGMANLYIWFCLVAI